MRRRAYFIASLRGAKDYGSDYKRIYNILSSFGFMVYSPILSLTQSEVEKFSRSDFAEYFKSDAFEIRSSDIIVAEISTSSSNVGYEVGYAFAQKKPILLLQSTKSPNSTAPAYLGNKSKLIKFSRYNQNNLENKIDKFIKNVEKKILTSRLPIEFTQEQMDFIKDFQLKNRLPSFNSAVRELIDRHSSIEVS